jgi:multiple sugar transport system permease protein
MLRAERLDWTLLATPMVAFLLLFLGAPTLVNLVYSVSEVGFETLRAPRLSGLGNYAAVLGDPAFWTAVWFSLRFATVTALAECGLGFFLAIFLDPLLRKRPWLIAVLMAPLMVAPALVGLMYRLALHEFVGPIPHYWRMVFDASPAFLSGAATFWTLCVIEILQWTPFAFLLFHLAHASIPDDLREAAVVDGARPLQILRWIEAPLMLPTVALALFVRFIDGFRVFDNVYVLVGAGPGGSTASMSIFIYESFFKRGAIGEAVAASVLLFAVSFSVLAGAAAAARRREAR